MEGHPCINCRHPTNSALLSLTCNHVFHLECYMAHLHETEQYFNFPNICDGTCPTCNALVFDTTFLNEMNTRYPRGMDDLEEHPAILIQTNETFQKDLLEYLKVEKKYHKVYSILQKHMNTMYKEFRKSIDMSVQFIKAQKKFYISQIQNSEIYKTFIKYRFYFKKKHTFMKRSYGSLRKLYELNRVQGIKGLPRIPIRFREGGFYRHYYRSSRDMVWRFRRVRI